MGDGAEKSSFPRLPVRCVGPGRVCPRREHEHADTAVQRRAKAGAGEELWGDGGGAGRPGPPRDAAQEPLGSPLGSRWGHRGCRGCRVGPRGVAERRHSKAAGHGPARHEPPRSLCPPGVGADWQRMSSRGALLGGGDGDWEGECGRVMRR